MANRSKRYAAAAATIDRGTTYSPTEALDLIKKAGTTKFDETVDVVVKLGIDPRKTDQLVRGAVSLPKGLGKTVKVIVFAEGDKAEAAKAAGADEVGSGDLADKISGGWLDFDVVIASPDMMRHVGKLGKVLGPQGKMPSPKSGTVTPNVADAVKDFKATLKNLRKGTKASEARTHALEKPSTASNPAPPPQKATATTTYPKPFKFATESRPTVAAASAAGASSSSAVAPMRAIGQVDFSKMLRSYGGESNSGATSSHPQGPTKPRPFKLSSSNRRRSRSVEPPAVGSRSRGVSPVKRTLDRRAQDAGAPSSKLSRGMHQDFGGSSSSLASSTASGGSSWVVVATEM